MGICGSKQAQADAPKQQGNAPGTRNGRSAHPQGGKNRFPTETRRLGASEEVGVGGLDKKAATPKEMAARAAQERRAR